MARSAAISASTNGSNTLVAAPASHQKIVVLGYVIIAAGTVNATFKSSTTTALTGALPLVAQAGVSAPVTPPTPSGRPHGWFACAPGEALTLALDAGVLVAGHLVYELQGV